MRQPCRPTLHRPGIPADTTYTATLITDITGDIGVSPIALTSATGFNETLDTSGTFATSALVEGRIYAANPEVVVQRRADYGPGTAIASWSVRSVN